MEFRHRLWVGVPVLVLGLWASGCHRPVDDSHRRAEGTVVVGVIGSLDNLNVLLSRDPGARQVEALVTAGFTRYGDRWEEEPVWAPEVPSVENRLLHESVTRLAVSYRTLPSARWSDQAPLTTDDFMCAYEMALLLPATQAPPWLKHVNYRTEGDQVLTLSFDTVAAAPPIDVLPLPAHAIRPLVQASAGQFFDLPYNHMPLSCGPFTLASNQDGRVELTPNPMWPRTKPALNRIVVRSFKDEASRLAALQAGQVDAANDLGSSEMAALAATAGPLQVDMTPSATVWVLAFPTGDPLFSAGAVRAMLAGSIDHAGLVHRVQGSSAPPAWSWLPPQHAAYSAAFKILQGDPAAGFKALRRLGVQKGPNGLTRQGLPLRLKIAVLEHSDEAWKAAQEIKTAWQGLGLVVEPESVSRAEMVGRFAKGTQHDPMIMPLDVGPRLDLSRLFSARAIPSHGNDFLGLNWAGWDNPENQALCDQFYRSSGVARLAVVQRQQALLAKEVPLVPLFYTLDYSVHDRDLLGFRPRGLPDITWNAEEWHWK